MDNNPKYKIGLSVKVPMRLHGKVDLVEGNITSNDDSYEEETLYGVNTNLGIIKVLERHVYTKNKIRDLRLEEILNGKEKRTSP